MDARIAAPLSARALPLPLRLLKDERLARLVGSGHDEAFSTLYERHHQPLYRYCRSLVGSDTDAQDALQSAMTAALVALRMGRRGAPVRPWLFRIAYNESVSLLRRRRPEVELPDEPIQVERSAHEAAEERARLASLVADLQQLPERQRGVLVMRELSGLSHDEVAQSFGTGYALPSTQGRSVATCRRANRSRGSTTQGPSMSCWTGSRTSRAA